MAKCRHCSAPMRANNQNCQYCGVRNDVDLHGRLSFHMVQPDSDRLCPNCEKPMQTIDLKIDGKFYIERCVSCYGLFFDSGEIEDVLDHGVSHDNHINNQLITNVSEDRYESGKEIKYKKCPVCQNFMLRRAFGYRSGVVVDRCMDHGVWLDSGELIHLLEWKKAGGQMADDKRTREKLAAEQRKTNTTDISGLSSGSSLRSGSRYELSSGLPDLEEIVGDALSSLVNTFFR